MSYQKTLQHRHGTNSGKTYPVGTQGKGARTTYCTLAPGVLLGPSVIPWHKIRRAELGQGKIHHEIKSYAQENAHKRIFKNFKKILEQSYFLIYFAGNLASDSPELLILSQGITLSSGRRCAGSQGASDDPNERVWIYRRMSMP